MDSSKIAALATIPDSVILHLRRLRVPVYLVGYNQLCVAITLFAADTMQAMCNELYPAVADALGYSDWRSVEFAIRRVIVAAWEQRKPEIWEEYFPGCQKAPSNKQFIATLALRIK